MRRFSSTVTMIGSPCQNHTLDRGTRVVYSFASRLAYRGRRTASNDPLVSRLGAGLRAARSSRPVHARRLAALGLHVAARRRGLRWLQVADLEAHSHNAGTGV